MTPEPWGEHESGPRGVSRPSRGSLRAQKASRTKTAKRPHSGWSVNSMKKVTNKLITQRLCRWVLGEIRHVFYNKQNSYEFPHLQNSLTINLFFKIERELFTLVATFSHLILNLTYIVSSFDIRSVLDGVYRLLARAESLRSASVEVVFVE